MKVSKRLVVDANVARSAGLGQSGSSRTCREVLDAILEICHRCVGGGTLKEEWDRNEGSYARSWRVQMISRKKLVVWRDQEDAASVEVWERILDALAKNSQEQRQAVQKDFHLVLAALAMDRVVISGDRKMRDLLDRAAEHVPELRGICWVKPDEDVLQWLEDGAPERPELCLGGRSDGT